MLIFATHVKAKNLCNQSLPPLMGAWGRTKLLWVKSLIPVLHYGCGLLPNYSSFLGNVFFNCRCRIKTRYFDCDFSCLSSLLSVVALRTSEGSLLSHSVISFVLVFWLLFLLFLKLYISLYPNGKVQEMPGSFWIHVSGHLYWLSLLTCNASHFLAKLLA